YGRVTPVLIADINLIDALALAQGSAEVGGIKNIFLSDELKNSLLRDINIDKVSRTTCIPTDNPFIDDKNSKVDLPVNEGVMLAGGKKSPFKITEFGGLRTAQDMPSIENETVYMKIDYRLDVTLLTGQAMGYICDKAIKL
ncbi:phage morphogenesis protein, partial [Clostridium botulinum C/D]|nr:phage morphogenesis protein [Clostridium botulinum C/D]